MVEIKSGVERAGEVFSALSEGRAGDAVSASVATVYAFEAEGMSKAASAWREFSLARAEAWIKAYKGIP